MPFAEAPWRDFARRKVKGWHQISGREPFELDSAGFTVTRIRNAHDSIKYFAPVWLHTLWEMNRYRSSEELYRLGRDPELRAACETAYLLGGLRALEECLSSMRRLKP